MYVVCLDLEGVLVPEIWINVAQATGIEKLKLTTRDISDYDELMQLRLSILDQHNLKLKDIQAVIETLKPMQGALDFLNWLRAHTQVIILSDTFVEFAKPLMQQLNWPTLFCHSLKIDSDNRVSGYKLRQVEQKKCAIEALAGLNFKTIAIGDSYNDTAMLQAADQGILFRPPDNVIAEFPQFPVTRHYTELQNIIAEALDGNVTD